MQQGSMHERKTIDNEINEKFCAGLDAMLQQSQGSSFCIS